MQQMAPLAREQLLSSIQADGPAQKGYSGFAQCSAAIFAVVNVSIAATGTGFLAFPFAFSQAGMALGVALCVITSLLCGYSLVVIAHCANQYQAKSYQQLVYLMFGVRAQHFIEWSVIVFNFFGNVISLQVIASQVAPLLSNWFHDNEHLSGCRDSDACNAGIMVAVTVLVTPLSLVRDISFLGPTSSLGALCVLYTALMVSRYGITEPETVPEYMPVMVNWRVSAFQAVPIVCFATMCHFTVVPATSTIQPYFPAKSLSDKGKTSFAAIVGVCIAVMVWVNLLYIPVGVLGYRAFGTEAASSQGNILNNFGVKLKTTDFKDTVDVQIARACMAVTTCLSYPVFTFITRLAIMDVLDGSRTEPQTFSWMRHIVVTVSFLVGCAITGVVVAVLHISLGFTVSVIGATVVVVVEFFFPAAMCWKLGWRFMACVLAIAGTIILSVGMAVTLANEFCPVNGGSSGSSGSSGSGFCADMGI